jgi:outer membrane protein OmpA-like peptidoglycan-associated protein
MPHQGIEITTAFTNSFGPDAESWMTTTAVTPEAIEVEYKSSRGMVAKRQTLISDRATARALVLGFSSKMPLVIPHTTSFGLSSAQLLELRSTGRTALALIYDTAMSKMDGELTLVEKDIRLPVLLDSQPFEAPAVQARGTFGKGGRQAVGDFYFLDSKNNPALLQYSINFSWEREPRTEKVVRVTAGLSEQAAMEQALKTIRSYELYGIHFDFDKATIRPESKSLVADIAVTLQNNPLWRLQVTGHTDSIGKPAYNQKLSGERAASVKAALVAQGIAPDRLEAAGAGAAEPKGDNGTLQGRALNRRVELKRLDR